jgi:apolipoprotein N-acyltransferase
MPVFLKQRKFRVLAALISGVLFYFSLGLNPEWMAAWVAPVPVLLAAFYCEDWREAALLSYLAVAIGISSNFTYYLKTTGVIATPILLLLQVLVWGFYVLRARSAVRVSKNWMTVFVYPVFQTGVGSLVSLVSPHGTWGSYGYTQMDALPVVQIASLLGSAAVVFLLGLFASTLAVGFYRGVEMDKPWIAYGLPIVLLALGAGYGFVRLHVADTEASVRVGLASVDDVIGKKTPFKDLDAVWTAYSENVGQLARGGARIVVLPEKMAAVAEDQMALRQRYFSAMAQRNSIYVAAGVQINHEDHKDNALWLFGPTGNLLAEYRKQHLVPALEGDLRAGHENKVIEIDGKRYGLAICRDLLFNDFGRAYGKLGVSALLVPAWDFYVDAWMETAVADMRGVENGYSVVRAGRESFLNVADRYGRVVARKRSDFLPGRSLIASVPLGTAVPTFYSRFGNWFGLLMVLGMLIVMFGRPFRSPL